MSSHKPPGSKPPANERVAKIAAKQALDDIVGSLQDLIRNELSEFSNSALADLADEFSLDQPTQPDSKIGPPVKKETAPIKRGPQDKRQLGLPQFDVDETDITYEMDAAKQDSDGDPDVTADITLEIAPPARTAPVRAPEKVSVKIEDQRDDIPVLDEIVATPTPVPAATPPNKPNKIYTIAIKVAARFNMEQRKLGEPELKAKSIDRFTSLLKEELEDAVKKRDL